MWDTAACAKQNNGILFANYFPSLSGKCIRSWQFHPQLNAWCCIVMLCLRQIGTSNSLHLQTFPKFKCSTILSSVIDPCIIKMTDDRIAALKLSVLMITSCMKPSIFWVVKYVPVIQSNKTCHRWLIRLVFGTRVVSALTLPVLHPSWSS